MESILEKVREDIPQNVLGSARGSIFKVGRRVYSQAGSEYMIECNVY